MIRRYYLGTVRWIAGYAGGGGGGLVDGRPCWGLVESVGSVAHPWAKATTRCAGQRVICASSMPRPEGCFFQEPDEWQKGGPFLVTPPPQGLALIFIPAGGGTPSPGPPPPLPWTPSPPPPSAQVHPKTWVLGTFFSHGKKFSAPSAHAIGNAMHAVRRQCEVLNVSQYSDPTFGPF